MKDFSPYDYLSFILPGGLVIAVASIGFSGVPTQEPGASWLVVLVAASFVVGHGVATVASWMEPLAWGHAPGRPTDPAWGLTGPRGAFEASEWDAISEQCRSRYPSASTFRSAWNMGYLELQAGTARDRLAMLNQQIGFYRNTTVACIASVVLVVAQWATGYQFLDPRVSLGIFGLGAVLFTYRFRRFWRYFGMEVANGMRLLTAKPLAERPTYLGGSSGG